MPEPTAQDKLQEAARRASAYGWHVASFLAGIITGYIVGVW